jgi:hypothetical protein
MPVMGTGDRQQLGHGRNQLEAHHAVAGDQRPQLVRVERRQDDGHSPGDAQRHPQRLLAGLGADREGVEEGQGAGGAAGGHLGGHVVGHDAGVRARHALGFAGGA